MGWCCTKRVVVRTKYGDVEGSARKRAGGVIVYTFYGVPFARPPVGPLRFKKPVEPEPWQDRLECHSARSQAVQSFPMPFTVFVPPLVGRVVTKILQCTNRDPRLNNDWRQPQKLLPNTSEDCLYLNIETPSVDPKAKKLPVMIWIHGGSFQVGNGAFDSTHERNIRPFASKGVVLVTLQYRLGLLGFAKVRGGDYNVGIWDQVAALRWVKQNIAGFGGDAENVTIFGESAGAFSVGVHLVSPHSKGLFHKAILQSGALQPSIPVDEHTRRVTQPLTQILGLKDSENQQDGELDVFSVENLSRMTAGQLLAAQIQLIQTYGGHRDQLEVGPLFFQPVQDGDLIPARKLDLLSGGACSDIPCVIGYTREEDSFFQILVPEDFDCRGSEQRYQQLVSALVADPSITTEAAVATAAEVKALVASQNAEGMSVGIGDALTRTYMTASSLVRFILPAHVAAEALARGGNRSVYMYRFDVGSDPLGGASPHAIDLPYTFAGFRRWARMLPNDKWENQRLHEIVIHAWTTFAATGTPELLPSTHLAACTWSPISTNEDVHLQLSANERAQPTFSTNGKEPLSTVSTRDGPRQRDLANEGSAQGGGVSAHKGPGTSSTHTPVCGVLVLDVPTLRCRVRHVDFKTAMPVMWKAANARTRPVFWVSPNADGGAYNDTHTQTHPHTDTSTHTQSRVVSHKLQEALGPVSADAVSTSMGVP